MAHAMTLLYNFGKHLIIENGTVSLLWCACNRNHAPAKHAAAGLSHNDCRSHGQNTFSMDLMRFSDATNRPNAGKRKVK